MKQHLNLKKLFESCNKNLKRRARSNDGFTLTEMLIVIAVIAMIATLVVSNVAKRFAQAKVDATKIQIKQLGTVLDQFKLTCNFYPLTDQGMDALIKKPPGRECKNYLEGGFIQGGKVPKDAWGNDFVYVSPDGKKYTIKSLGADEKEGGEGDDKDISSDDID